MSNGIVICRACIRECVEYKSLFKHGLILGEISTLASMLRYCTNVRIENGDSLPEYICTRCIHALARAYAFKKLVFDTNVLLRQQHSELDCSNKMHEANKSVPITNSESEAESEGLAIISQFKRGVDMQEYITLSVVEDVENHEFQSEITHDGTPSDIVNDKCYPTSNDAFESEEHLKVEYEDAAQDTESANEDLQDIQQEQDLAFSLSEVETDCHLISSSDGNVSKQKILGGRVKEVDRLNLQCQVCGKQLSNQNSFKYHMQLHSDATPFLCNLCGDGFKTRNAYEGHLVIHNPNNPNTCHICGKSYRQASSLRSHMHSHTGEKPFQCNICGKGMTQKSGYKKHLLIHTGEKPFKCEICLREFRYSSNLLAHKRCHSGEKPYDCSQCEKSFPTTEQLKRHKLVHSLDRPYSCDICNKNFKRRSSMISHKNTHDIAVESDAKRESYEKVSKSNIVELY